MSSTDEYLVCPYDSHHTIIRHRMPMHIVKCVKNYKGPALYTCPFNAVHRFPKENLQEHLLTCESYIINSQPHQTKTI